LIGDPVGIEGPKLATLLRPSDFPALHFNVRSLRAPIREAINLGFEIGRFLDEPRRDLRVFC
jgi:hypothetical protein